LVSATASKKIHVGAGGDAAGTGRSTMTTAGAALM
jgi:hypothetical protein